MDISARLVRSGRGLGSILLRLALVLAMIPVLLTPIFAFIDPPVTALQLWKRAGGAPIERRLVPLEEISPHLVRAVLMSEDGRFCRHYGIDPRELLVVLNDARQGKAARGASTITMQLVKNLYLWPGRSYVRKVLEFPLAAYVDLVLSKRRIMELYLNMVEWDRGIYGAEAAAWHYFGRPARALDAGQAARLAVVLPNPGVRDPVSPGSHTAQLARLIERRATRAGPHVTCVIK